MESAKLVRVTTLWKGEVMSVEHLPPERAPPYRGRRSQWPFVYLIEDVSAPEATPSDRDRSLGVGMVALVLLSLGVTLLGARGPGLSERVALALAAPDSTLQVVGGRARNSVVTGLHNQMDRLVRCRGESLGQVTLHFVIDPDGKIRKASVLKMRALEPRVERCLVRSMRAVSFPASEQPTWVNLPLVLAPKVRPGPGAENSPWVAPKMATRTPPGGCPPVAPDPGRRSGSVG